MDTERATARREIREQRVQVGVVGEHCGELVDDDHEPRQCASRGARHCIDVAHPGLGERTLAESQLGPQALERPECAVLVKIGHDADGVRQRLECRERRAALEIDEQERDPIRWMPRRHRHDPRDEQLALAAARRAAHDGMWTVLDQVDLDRSIDTDREDSPQPSFGWFSAVRRLLEQRLERDDGRQHRGGADSTLPRSIASEHRRPRGRLTTRHDLGPEAPALGRFWMPDDRRDRASGELDDDAACGGQLGRRARDRDRDDRRVLAGEPEFEAGSASTGRGTVVVRQEPQPLRLALEARVRHPPVGRWRRPRKLHDDRAQGGLGERARTDDADAEPGVDGDGCVRERSGDRSELVKPAPDAVVRRDARVDLEATLAVAAAEADEHRARLLGTPAVRIRAGSPNDARRSRRHLPTQRALTVVASGHVLVRRHELALEARGLPFRRAAGSQT